jgi:hypothetical protein
LRLRIDGLNGFREAFEAIHASDEKVLLGGHSMLPRLPRSRPSMEKTLVNGPFPQCIKFEMTLIA